MPKVKLQLGAELDVLSAGELSDALGKHGGWEREAAFGMRHQDLPRLIGTTDGSGNLNLGADQAEGQYCGPKEGWYWGVSRVSVDGLAASESVKLYKDTRFICNISQATGFATFTKGGCVLKAGDYLRVVAAGLTHAEQLTVTGECVSVPGPLMWKILG
jgi:hypothetical protein